MEEIQVDKGFAVDVNPRPILQVVPQPMSQEELDYLEWFDEINKEAHDE